MTSNTLNCHLCQVVLADNESTVKKHISSVHLNYRPFDCNTCNEEENSFKAATEESMDAHIAISHSATNSGYRIIKDKTKEDELKAAIVECRRPLTLQHSSVDTPIAPRKRSLSVNDHNNQMPTTSKGKSKPFKCGQCSFASAGKGNLVQHVRSHTVKKPFKCDQCSYTCANKGSFNVHVRIHNGKKPFKCDQCSFTTAQKGNLNLHVRIHAGEKPFKCDQCSYTSTLKGNLARHMRTHTGEKTL